MIKQQQLQHCRVFLGKVWFIQRLSHAGERQLCFWGWRRWGGIRGRQKYPLQKSISGQKSIIFRDLVPFRIIHRGKNKSLSTRLGHLQPGLGDIDSQSKANLSLPEFQAQNLHIPRFPPHCCSFFSFFFPIPLTQCHKNQSFGCNFGIVRDLSLPIFLLLSPLFCIKIVCKPKSSRAVTWLGLSGIRGLDFLLSASSPPVLSKKFPLLQHFPALSPPHLSDRCCWSEFLKKTAQLLHFLEL